MSQKYFKYKKLFSFIGYGFASPSGDDSSRVDDNYWLNEEIQIRL